jgi:hypothetical protein
MYLSPTKVINEEWWDASGAGLSLDRRDSMVLDDNNNLLSEINTIPHPNTYTDKTTLTYDTKKSAYSQVNIDKYASETGSFINRAANNVKERMLIRGPNIDNTVTQTTQSYQYEYSSNDFPVKAYIKWTTTVPNSPLNSIVTYEYY